MLYDIDNIWSGRRNMFMSSDSQESAAVQLLTKLDLSLDKIQNLVKNYDIDSDVADSRGNTRLMISAVNDFNFFWYCHFTIKPTLYF